MEKTRIFDLNDKDIVSVYDDLSLWAAAFGLRLLESISLKKQINVLDIGFGTGFPLLEIAERLGSSSIVYGIDPWKAAIERTQLKIDKREISNVKLFCGTAENMPFQDDFFDLIVSNNGINNVSDQIRVFKECNRVCKCGAQFIATFNLPDTMIEFYSIFEKILRENKMFIEIEKLKEHIHDKRKPLDYMYNLYNNSGFSIVDSIQDKFTMKFIDGNAMLDYFFIRLCFLGKWTNIIKEENKELVFKRIIREIDLIAAQKGEFILTVPFALIIAEKK
jgi:arsenite methyltransferase